MKESDSEIVNTWIEKADHNLGSAKLIFLHIPDYFDTIAFHCQQAVEKYLKASLIHLGIEFQRSHDLPYLLEMLSGKVEIRYPNQIIHLTKNELKSAISIADDFRQLAVLIIELN